MSTLSEQQLAFFETFGYLQLPGLLADEIGWITEEFEAVFQDRGIVHDPTKRSIVLPFIDQREKLCTLIDLPQIEGVLADILGDDFAYLGSDGNFYSGDTHWHADGNHESGKWVKLALYLDPVGRDSGCLRVIPGSHRIDDWAARMAGQSQDLWGIPARDVPCMPLESVPGDVVIFNQNLLHAAVGGGSRRRMMALSFISHLTSEDELVDLRHVIGVHARFWCESMHTDIMRQTGPESRRRHLKLIAENEGHLPGLVAQARETMEAPSQHA